MWNFVLAVGHMNIVLNIIWSVDNYKDMTMQLRLCVKILM